MIDDAFDWILNAENNFYKERFIKEKTKNNNENGGISATLLSEEREKQENNNSIGAAIDGILNADNNLHKIQFKKKSNKNNNENGGFSATFLSEECEKQESNNFIADAINGILKADNNFYKEQFVNNNKNGGFSATFLYEECEKQEKNSFIAAAIDGILTVDNNFYKEELLKEKTKNNNQNGGYSDTVLSGERKKQENNKFIADAIDGVLNDDKIFYKKQFVKE